MLKNHRHSVANSFKQSKHENEMATLRAHQERVLKDAALRAELLVGSGVFVRASDGKLVVAKPYNQVILSKRAA